MRAPVPTGLRARLLLAFVLVAVAGSAAAAWASAGSASASLVDAAQRRLTGTVEARIAAVAPQLTYPPDEASLDRLRAAVGPNTVVTYRDLRSADGTAPAAGDLRDAVRTGDRLVARRTVSDGTPWLLIGTPVLRTAVDGTRAPSGIEVYTARDLGGVERQLDDLVTAASGTAALTLPIAAVLALVAGGGVLRPVRRLRDTARRLASGDLDARATPRGADELTDLTATVNEMAASVQSSMATMERMRADARRFAADVAHELRTPLSTLTAVVEVLETATEELDEDARESARLALTETQRLVALVEDLMEVSRFDAGTARLRLEDVDVTDTVRSCLRARNWSDRVEVDGEDGLVLRADPRRLDVVVANLVGNALRHGEPPVRVRVSADSGEARLEVTDGGPGLPEDVLPHVFDRFYKADAARTRTPGSGLGLAIAQENAQLHGGELTADNAGGGARFTLRLPRHEPEVRT